MSLGRLLRGNAHAFNYLLLAGGALVPVLLYAQMRSPSQEQVEAVLKENYADRMDRQQRSSDKMSAFWKRRQGSDMDEVYSQLLRSGKSTVKRHYELTGSLNSAEEAQDPEYARMHKLLGDMTTTEAETKAAAAAAATAGATAGAGAIASVATPAPAGAGAAAPKR